MKHRKLVCILLALALIVGLLPTVSFAAERSYESGATLTFGSSGVAETVAGSGYEIVGTTLTVSAAGVYTVTGACAEGNIVVKKGTTGVVLILRDLTLACSTTAPLACNKTTETTLYIEGSVTLTDKEDPANETSTDTALADAFEGAAIKAKSGSKLTIEGPGTLTADGSACKNGVKGGATSTVTVNMDGKLIVKAANNGLAADGEVVIKKGTLDITAGNEGVKAEPDTTDAESRGEITVTGGSITINAQSDGMQATNLITISGGSFNINAQRDGIQSNGDLMITDGAFTIKTFGGYNASGFNEDTMSCKGLKASGTDEDVENATNKITILGGTFVLNTRDDAVHSDGYIYITGGSFDIYTGDDGMHADSELHLGTTDGLERDPDVRVNSSYEGLEAGNLYIYGGRYYVVASDDGINAAGGTGDNFNPGGPGGGVNPWNPGGPGGPGGGGGPGQNVGDYSINISGGSVYVNCNADGLDSNGALNLTGGVIEVWSMSSGDNSPLDSDGTLTVKGATVFAAGAKGVDDYPKPQGGQSYKNYTSGLSISSGKVVSIKNGSTVVFNTKAPKSAQFVFYSSPSFSTSWTCAAANGSVSCAKGNSWAHTWDAGVVTTTPATDEMGVTTYTCTVCGAAETQTIPALAPEEADSDPQPDPDPDEGFAVTFVTDEGSSLQVYETQDVTGSSLLNIGQNSSDADVSRNGTTGDPDSTGEGQVNFVVLVAEGYVLEAVTATEGTYKNIKLVSSEGSVYVYRVTKITAETTVSVATKKTGTDPDPDPQPDPDPDAGFAVTFVTDANSSLDVFRTQDVTGDPILSVGASDTGAEVSRNSETGEPDSTGDGQVNFVVTVDEGYEMDVVSATEGTYKNIKLVSSEGNTYVYRVTKITAETTVSVATKTAGEEPPEPETGFEVTFTAPEYAEIWVYNTQTLSGEADVVIAAGESGTVLARDTQGQPDVSGNGQVNFVVVPAEGYEVDTVSASGSYKNLKGPDETGIENGWRITKIAAGDVAVTVTVKESANDEPDPEKPVFTDVAEDAYYADAVNWAVESGVTQGTGNNKFSPNATCTRAQVVTFLWRAKGSPEPESLQAVIPSEAKNLDSSSQAPQNDMEGDSALDVPFDDVKTTDYYYKAVLWAVEQGITQGTGNGKFSPNKGCTRGQVVTFLWRCEGKPDAAIEPGENELPIQTDASFTDVQESDYFYEAVQWAVASGITNGTGNGKFSPNKTCTRGQIVTFLYRDLA